MGHRYRYRSVETDLAISVLQLLSLYGNKALSSKIDFSEMHVLHLNAQNADFHSNLLVFWELMKFLIRLFV